MREDTVLRFRSGTHYHFVAVTHRPGVWRTTASDYRTDDCEPITEFAYNAIGKVERWADIIARANNLAYVTQWRPPPPRTRVMHAVVRFVLVGAEHWDAAIHVGHNRWHSTVEQASGVLIGSWSDITKHSTHIEMADSWQRLPDGLPHYSEWKFRRQRPATAGSSLGQQLSHDVCGGFE
ncbi:hypothetical protein [Mycolicibacter arupensis]|jgi:hypothetical protein|uniref:Uncharacterized protein n=1 Tax=Mycolicibacter arupensis TaxID=342002 RepID=A0A5C7XLK1_9MYCO|nr:hypothetical protein [Mycolicibacter arupensis]MCV7275727.1 hypothetical protein [Mycolicibacter arupensis]TXI50253.1 MAG: hypothetical protein E6Q54_21630 [Mycolicibacter arupensis]